MATIAQGSSASVDLTVGSYFTLTTQPNVEGYYTIAPQNSNDGQNVTQSRAAFGPPQVAGKQIGPFQVPVTATIYAVKGSVDYVATSTSGSSATPEQIAFRTPLKLGFAGDSIANMWASKWGDSPVWWASTELYPCEYTVHMNTSLGGTSSSHLISNQIATLEALSVKPDVVIVQTLQNDYIGSTALADTYFANVQQYSQRALAAGVKLVVICSKPPKSSSPDVAAALGYLNRRIDRYCRDTPGNFYCDVFNAWRRTNAADTSGVAWRGTAGAADAFSEDGTHPTGLASRNAAPLILPILQRFARPVQPFPSVAVAYDNTNYPYGNLLGINGLMLGTNGQYNGVNNANVAGNSTGAQDRWFLTDGNGITATPTLVTGSDGFTYQNLVLSGTATADATVLLRTAYIQDVASGTFIGEAIVNCQNVTGVRDMGVLFAGFTTATIVNNAGAQFSLNNRMHFRTEPTVFSNSGFSNRTNDIIIKVKNGVTVSGTVQVGRVGIFRI